MLESDTVELIFAQHRRINSMAETIKMQSESITSLTTAVAHLRYRIEQLEKIIDTQD